MFDNSKQKRAITKMVKCLTEDKMKSAIEYLREAVEEKIKQRIVKALKTK